MYCEKCGANIDPGDAFCPECGARVEDDATVRMAYNTGDSGRKPYDGDQYENDGYDNRQYRGDRYENNSYDRNQYRYEKSGKQYRPDEDFYQSDYRKRDHHDKQDGKDKVLYIFLGVLTVLLVAGIIWGVVTLLDLNGDDDEVYEDPGEATEEVLDPELSGDTEEEVTVTPTPTEVPAATPVETPIPTPIVTEPPATPIPTPVPTQPPVSSSNGDYIFADSSSRLLSSSELAGLSEWELRIARNEIYARHGRIFKDSALDSYFRGKSWYVPSIPADSFDDNNILSKTELKNAKLISDYEAAHGYN